MVSLCYKTKKEGMEDMKTAILFLMAGLIVGSVAISGVYAQTDSAPAAAASAAPAVSDEEAYGEVVSVDAGACKVTITEYDYDKDEDVNKTYAIDKAATYENVKSLAEIKQGDWVAITLKKQQDGSVSGASVYVEKYDFEEPAAAPEAEPAAPAAPEPPEDVE